MLPRSATVHTPWLVKKHHQFRSLSFLAVLAVVVLHLRDTPFNLPLWLYLCGQLVVYPQVRLAVIRRAANPVASEVKSLWFDAYSLGLCAAVLGLPTWISFAVGMASLYNSAFNLGWRGSVQAAVAFVLGVATWWASGHLVWQPDSDWPTTLFCMAGLLVYVLGIGDVAHIRIGQLHRLRQERELSAQAIEQANEALRRQLEENGRLQEQLREQAHRDPLTGQYNRRYLDTTLQRELLRCARDGSPLSLLMVDIDHFKTINDTHGHPVGDEVLRQMGLILATHARAHDVVCRYGGEEFLLMLPHLPLAQALQRAEQLRRAVQNHVFPTTGGDIRLTLSAGVACHPLHGSTVEELLRSADHALYQAKREGRNRVVQAT